MGPTLLEEEQRGSHHTAGRTRPGPPDGPGGTAGRPGRDRRTSRPGLPDYLAGPGGAPSSSRAASAPPSSPRSEPMRATDSGRLERSQSSPPMPSTSQIMARYGVHFRMPGGGG